jgi:hypothetical protein
MRKYELLTGVDFNDLENKVTQALTKVTDRDAYRLGAISVLPDWEQQEHRYLWAQPIVFDFAE